MGSDWLSPSVVCQAPVDVSNYPRSFPLRPDSIIDTATMSTASSSQSHAAFGVIWTQTNRMDPPTAALSFYLKSLTSKS